jgi:hypothetical protein
MTTSNSGARAADDCRDSRGIPQPGELLGAVDQGERGQAATAQAGRPVHSGAACRQRLQASAHRLLAAQALNDNLAIVSGDPVFRKYGPRRVW